MPLLTRLPPTPARRVTTESFPGYDHRLKAPEGSFYRCENLSLERYPLMSVRRPRGLVSTLSDPGGLIGKDALCWVDGGVLYVNALPTPLTGLSRGEKQLVSMGAYVLIFPDKCYYNTEDPTDFGSMEAELEIQGEIRLSLCDGEGQPLEEPTVSPIQPEEPVNGQLWLDSELHKLLRYSETQLIWVELPTVYTRISFPCRGRLKGRFSRYDGVRLEGTGLEALDGEKILYALGGSESEDDWIAVVGLIQENTSLNADVRLSRTLPEMDFVCQAGNRLWGCRYGRSGEKTVNEIYGSALGDFKNFRQFLGLAGDSWAASVGSDGQWTGAVNYLGQPCFFKEDRVHTVSISSSGAHRLEEIPCRGVQKGSHRSLCVVGETLYYKSREDVCAWQGGFPVSVSAALGEERYDSAAAGSLNGRYYLSMRGKDGWSLFCYDPALGLWTREDALHAVAFAGAGGELYALEADSGRLLAMSGKQGEPEGPIPWMAETGPLRYATVDRKTLSRYDLSLSMEAGASVGIWLRYDSRGDWIPCGSVSAQGSGTLVFPIRPRRCDHLQMRLKGQGQVTLYALSRILETGSDL